MHALESHGMSSLPRQEQPDWQPHVSASPGTAGLTVSGAQQPSPRHASRPSFAATMAMIRAATGSAHHQPNKLLSPSPNSSTADRSVHRRACIESATALVEPS